MAHEHNKPTVAEEVAKDLVSLIVSILGNVAHWQSAFWYITMTLCTRFDKFRHRFKAKRSLLLVDLFKLYEGISYNIFLFLLFVSISGPSSLLLIVILKSTRSI